MGLTCWAYRVDICSDLWGRHAGSLGQTCWAFVEDMLVAFVADMLAFVRHM